MLLVKTSTATVNCRIDMFLYFNLCLSVMRDSLSCSFTSISFLTSNKLFLYFNLCLSVMRDSLSCSFTSISFLTSYKLFLYFNLCLSVIWGSLSYSFTSISFPWYSGLFHHKTGSVCCLTTSEQLFQLYHGENQLHFDEMMMMSE